jgi:hypothetical protein
VDVAHTNATFVSVMQRVAREARRILLSRIRSVKWSRCFFILAGVFGLKCSSIRDGTVPTSPHIVARRAAMAKKRKAKKAKKARKKK